MRVLVTRPEPEAAQTAADLAARGHEPVLAPLTRIVATGARLPEEAFDATIVTSARAIESLKDSDLPRLRALPVLCVGERTGEAARARGLRVEATASDARGLLALLAARREQPRRVLYLAGRDRKPLLEETLRRNGRVVATAVLYEARE